VVKKLWWFTKYALVIYALTAAIISLFAIAQSQAEPESFAPADVIIVLGGGMDADGTLHQATRLRVRKGVALFQAGTAPKILFTGGRAVETGPSSGDMMARLAMQLGVPAAAIITETRSLSTLQNALFSMPKMEKATRIIIVTEGFHLLRSWLSFQWVALIEAQTLDIALAHSTIFRPDSGAKLVAREALAFWFNLGRAALWHIGGWLNVAPDTRDSWLE